MVRGNCSEDKLENCTVLELKNICKKYKIKGYSKLKKADLIRYINKKLIFFAQVESDEHHRRNMQPPPRASPPRVSPPRVSPPRVSPPRASPPRASPLRAPPPLPPRAPITEYGYPVEFVTDSELIRRRKKHKKELAVKRKKKKRTGKT